MHTRSSFLRSSPAVDDRRKMRPFLSIGRGSFSAGPCPPSNSVRPSLGRARVSRRPAGRSKYGRRPAGRSTNTPMEATLKVLATKKVDLGGLGLINERILLRMCLTSAKICSRKRAYLVWWTGPEFGRRTVCRSTCAEFIPGKKSWEGGKASGRGRVVFFQKLQPVTDG